MKKLLLAFTCALALVSCDGGRKTKSGDTVVINFAGFVDGVQFEGGTASAFPLRLGSGMFIPGFEEQLIGLKKGDTIDVNVTFPEVYVPELAGRDAVFKVEILEIR